MKQKQEKKSETQKEKRKQEKEGLSASEKKRLKELKSTLAGTNKKQKTPDTAQKSITFQKMYRDGICQVKRHEYSKMVEFYDINYKLLEEEEKGDILEDYSKLLNYFDPEIKFQLFLFNRKVSEERLARQFEVKEQEDTFNEIRKEYEEMLKKQSLKGTNGIVKSKFLVFVVESQSFCRILINSR